MKKIGLLFVGVCMVMAVLCVSDQEAFAYSVNWGNSIEDGRDGRAWLSDWLTHPANGGYFANDAAGKLAAWNYASNNYIDYTQTNPFYWNNAYPTTYKIEQEVARFANMNVLGYYMKGQSGNLNTIFNGPDNSGTPAKTFSINGDFGLYLYTPQSNRTWFTDLYLNDYQFPMGLVYRLPDVRHDGTIEWLVAWDDLSPAGGDFDYNDMYVRISTVTPEPVSSALFILGGGAIAVLKLRKKKS